MSNTFLEIQIEKPKDASTLYFAVCQMTYSNGMRFLNP